MADIRTVVFPVDFSNRSKGAAHYVEALASKFTVDIKLVHVLPPAHYEAMSLEVSGPMLADVLAAQEANGKKLLEEFLADELRPHRVQRVLLKGEPAEAIVKYAAEIPGSLLLLPTHGYGPFRRFILGSVTAKVLHDAMGPVLTGVHMEGSPEPEKINIRTVLAAVDLEGGSAKVMEWATAIAKAYSAKLVVTHVAPSIEGRSGELFDPKWREFFAEGATKAIKDLLAKGGIEAEVVVAFGDPSKQVTEVAASTKSDLVVIGRAHEGGSHGRLRTHAYAIIRMAPCPVLSV